MKYFKRNKIVRRDLLIGTVALAANTPLPTFAGKKLEVNSLSYKNKSEESYVYIRSEDKSYEALKKGFNLRWPDQEGASCIYICKTEKGIIDAVSHAHANNRRITIRSGGHCYEGFVSNKIIPNDLKSKLQDLAIIDIGLIKKIEYKEDASVISDYDKSDHRCSYILKAASGNQNWDIYVKLYKQANITIPGGSCYSVGLGGQIAGGGYGLLSRKYGLTVDWLSGVDILVPIVNESLKKTIGFEIRHIHRNSHLQRDRDLFIACCGAGGGNFGVIINYYFKVLPPAPDTAYIINLIYKWEDIKDIKSFKKFIHAYWKWFSANNKYWNSDDPNKNNGGLFAILKLNHINTGDINLLVQYTGIDGTVHEKNNAPFIDFIKFMNDAADGKLIEPALVKLSQQELLNLNENNRDRDVTAAIIKKTRKMDWLYLTQSINDSGGNQYAKYKSVYQKKSFSDRSINSLFKFLSNKNQLKLTQSLVQIDSYGGCINDKLNGAETSVYQRNSILKWQFQTYWTDKEDEFENLMWIRNIYSSCFINNKPYERNNPEFQGCYINYPDVDMKYFDYDNNKADVNWLELYYGRIISKKLLYVKNIIDPVNIFRHELSIPIS